MKLNSHYNLFRPSLANLALLERTHAIFYSFWHEPSPSFGTLSLAFYVTTSRLYNASTTVSNYAP